MVWYLYLSESPDSHLETACGVTESFCASCSCVSPALWRRDLIFFPRSMVIFRIHPFRFVLRPVYHRPHGLPMTGALTAPEPQLSKKARAAKPPGQDLALLLSFFFLPKGKTGLLHTMVGHQAAEPADDRHTEADPAGQNDPRIAQKHAAQHHDQRCQ